VFSQSDTSDLFNIVEEAAESDDTLSQARGLYKLGIYFDKNNNRTRSNFYLHKAVELAVDLEDKRPAGIIINYLASNYSEQGKHDEVIKLYEQAFELSISSGDSILAANVLINLGSTYADGGQFDKALEVDLQALRIREACNDSSNIAYYYQQVGELFKELGQKDSWKSYLFLADSLSRNAAYADITTRIAILNDLGGYYTSQRDMDAAEKSYSHMYQLSVQEGYDHGISIFLSNMVPIYKAQNRYDEAMESVKESYKMAEESGRLFQMMTRANLMASLYFEMKLYEDAFKWYNKAILLSQDYSFPKERSRALFGLSQLSMKQENWKSAYAYLDEHLLLKDSLEGNEVKMKMAELEALYQAELKENQIELLNRENRIQAQQIKLDRTITWAIILLLFFVVGLLLFLFWRSQTLAKSRAVDLEQRWLRSQMNPHFIFNALGSIQSYIHQRKDDTASYFLSKFAALTRAILENSKKEHIPLSEEIENLTNYVEIEKMRQIQHLEFKVSYSDDLETDFINIPPMLIQPFIENSIKHAFRGKEKDCVLMIDFKEDGEFLRIEMQDNGIGINNSDTKEGHQSMALSIFKERIRLIEKRMKKPVFFEIADLRELNSGETGTRVEVKLPLDL